MVGLPISLGPTILRTASGRVTGDFPYPPSIRYGYPYEAEDPYRAGDAAATSHFQWWRAAPRRPGRSRGTLSRDGGGSMIKTTLNIDPEVMRRLKQEAARQG